MQLSAIFGLKTDKGRVTMNTKKKGDIILYIIKQLRFTAERNNKPFDEGDLFFSLAFRTDKELKQILKLCGGNE
jgi:hypothetical protein